MLAHKLWYYTVSHDQLLIRRPGTPNDDHLFTGVDGIMLSNTYYYDLSVEMIHEGATKYDRNIYSLLGLDQDNAIISGEIYAFGHKHSLNANNVWIYEDYFQFSADFKNAQKLVNEIDVDISSN